MRLIWADTAEADLDDIFDYIARDSPSAAVDVEGRIRGAAGRLVRMPRLGRKGGIVGTYELVVPRTSHFIVYGIEGDVVMVFHVTHGRQQWPPAQ